MFCIYLHHLLCQAVKQVNKFIQSTCKKWHLKLSTSPTRIKSLYSGLNYGVSSYAPLPTLLGLPYLFYHGNLDGNMQRKAEHFWKAQLDGHSSYRSSMVDSFCLRGKGTKFKHCCKHEKYWTAEPTDSSCSQVDEWMRYQVGLHVAWAGIHRT